MLIILGGCNKDLTEEELEELWSNAQTTGQIIERSGTVFNSATNKDLTMRDATTRLQLWQRCARGFRCLF